MSKLESLMIPHGPAEYLYTPSAPLNTTVDGRKKIEGLGLIYWDETNPATQQLLFHRPDGPGTKGMWVQQRFLPGSATEWLNAGGQVSHFNHNPDLILGRVGINLRISEEKLGVRYWVDVLDDVISQRVWTLADAGILQGSSVTHFVLKEDLTKEKGELIRYVLADKIDEIGPVFKPAFTATTVVASGGVREPVASLTSEEPGEDVEHLDANRRIRQLWLDARIRQLSRQ